MSVPFPVFTVLDGMEAFFLGVHPIGQRIGKRMFYGIAPERAVALENTQTERSPRTGPTVEYTDQPWEPQQNVDGQSTYNPLLVGFQFWGFLPKDARDTFSLFYEALPNNRYTGTWGGFTIKTTNWIGTEGVMFDETYRQAAYGAVLKIRFEDH